MPYSQSIERAFKSRIGEGGIDDQAFARMLAHAEGELENLRDKYRRGVLPLLRLPERTDDFPALKRAAKKSPLIVSAVSGAGVTDVLRALFQVIEKARGRVAVEASPERAAWQP